MMEGSESPMTKFDAITVEEKDGVSVVRFVDDKIMDVERIQKLNEELSQLAESENSRDVLLNLENVRFLSSAAINKLIVLDKRVKSHGGRIRLASLRPEVRDVFSITNLDRVFKIYDDPEEALKSFDATSNKK
jgi:anti-sigma B factor antagonist